MTIEWELPPAPRSSWIDAPPPAADHQTPPDVRRDGLWVIEDEDIVWEAPRTGTMTQ